MTTPNNATRDAAVAADQADDWSSLQERFYRPDGGIYLDGNSLGLLSKDAEAAILRALEEWKHLAIDGWTKATPSWYTLPEELGALSAPLVGAKEHEVVVCGSTTVNLHTLLATFYHPTDTRTKIIADSDNFPSDLYALHSHLQLHGRPDTDLILVQPNANGWMNEDDIIQHITDDVALVHLPSVWYKSGQRLNIHKIAQVTQERGIPLGIDACHSIGIMPHQFHDDGVDFAVWCNYKYLNAGPGATAGLFVHEKHHSKRPGLAGWFGSDKDRQFDMSFPQIPSHTAGQWQIGTPPVLSTVGVEASLRMMNDIGIGEIRARSLKQTTYLRNLLEQRIFGEGLGGQDGTPREDDRRGGHIAFEHPHAVAVGKALKAQGVIPDFRPPYTLRLAPIPLYTTWLDIWQAVDILHDILMNETYLQYGASRDVVS